MNADIRIIEPFQPFVVLSYSVAFELDHSLCSFCGYYWDVYNPLKMNISVKDYV